MFGKEKHQLYYFEEKNGNEGNICKTIHKFYHRDVFVYFLGGNFSMLIKKNISTKAGRLVFCFSCIKAKTRKFPNINFRFWWIFSTIFGAQKLQENQVFERHKDWIFWTENISSAAVVSCQPVFISERDDIDRKWLLKI